MTNEELVERLATAFGGGEDATARGESYVNNGIRAVLAELAKMGADVLPSGDDLRDVLDEHASVDSQQTVEFYADHVHSIVAPIIAAKNAEIVRQAEILAGLAKMGADGIGEFEIADAIIKDEERWPARQGITRHAAIAWGVVAPILAAKDVELARLRGHSAHLQRLLDDADATIEELRAKKGSES